MYKVGIYRKMYITLHCIKGIENPPNGLIYSMLGKSLVDNIVLYCTNIRVVLDNDGLICKNGVGINGNNFFFFTHVKKE